MSTLTTPSSLPQWLNSSNPFLATYSSLLEWVGSSDLLLTTFSSSLTSSGTPSSGTLLHTYFSAGGFDVLNQ